MCGGQLTDVSYGTINSPGYPGNYPINRDCIWTISASPGNVISITFAYMAIEVHANCSYDYLEVCLTSYLCVLLQAQEYIHDQKL